MAGRLDSAVSDTVAMIKGEASVDPVAIARSVPGLPLTVAAASSRSLPRMTPPWSNPTGRAWSCAT